MDQGLKMINHVRVKGNEGKRMYSNTRNTGQFVR